VTAQFKLYILYFICGAGLYACYSNPVSEVNGVPAIQLIRNDKHIMDIHDSPFIRYPDYQKFSICHGNTCRYISTLSLTRAEWQKVSSLFDNVTTAGQEREQIRQAIGLLEVMIGEKTGTSNDLGENAFVENVAGQMDCVDESTNTTVYLTLMQRENLLKWHRVQHRVNRGISSLQWPHFTAVIRDMQDGLPYAVDSWFLGNGELPFIVPLAEWKHGWRPDPVSREQSNQSNAQQNRNMSGT